MACDKCANQEQNRKNCRCPSRGCPRHGLCCECVAYHIKSGDTPMCFRTRR